MFWEPTQKAITMKVNTAARMGEVTEYYFSRKLKEIAKRNGEGADIINLGIGSPDLPPPPAVIEALQQSLSLPKIHQYQSYIGIPSLREAMANWYLQHFSVALNPASEILPLIGSKEGIMHISMAFLGAGDAVLVPDPGYPTYSAAAQLSGATILKYQLSAANNWLPDLQKLGEQNLDKVKIMWVNYPHMPSGAAASSAFFSELIDFARQHQILLCNDNPYSFILNDERLSLLSIPGAKEVAMELNSLSKSHHMAGWRIGMLSGAAENISAVLRFKSNMDSGMFKGLQTAAVQALNTPMSWHDTQNAIYQKRKEVAITIIEKLKCSFNPKQVGMFLWGEVSNKWKDGYALSDYLLDQANVFITPGGIFGNQGNKYIRISLCSDVQRLEDALERIDKSKKKIA